MKREPVKNRCCVNPHCSASGKFGNRKFDLHSFYTTRQGRRCWYLCEVIN